MARQTWVQSQIESYKRLQKWYLMLPCLTLSIIRYGSKVKWINPGKRVAPFLTPWCSSYRQRSFRVAIDYGRKLYFFIYSTIDNPKALFSLSTTPRCRGGCFFFPWIAPFYPWSLSYNTECYGKKLQEPFFKSLVWLDLKIKLRSTGILANTLPTRLLNMYIYILYRCIQVITLKIKICRHCNVIMSSSLSYRAGSTDIPDPLSQLLPIVHRPR